MMGWICGAAAIILGFSGLITVMDSDKENIMTLHIGTYGEYLHIYEFDSESLEFNLSAKLQTRNASYVIADSKNIYAVSECGEESGVYSFSQKERSKTAEKRQTGADPCFLLNLQGRYLLSADYSGGSVSIFPIEEGGIGDLRERLSFSGSGPVQGRQESSHIHQLKMLPDVPGDTDGRWILATDLGADKIRLLQYGKDQKIQHIADIDCPAGSGPRHMEFSIDGRMLYCIAELSGEVLVYNIDCRKEGPAFRLAQRIQADEVNAGGSADIHLHPSGKYLYTSHRLDNDGICIFRILSDGTLEKIGYEHTGKHPRNFMISSDGRLLLVACRDDKAIQVFRIEEDGKLNPTDATLYLEDDQPSSITSVLKSL